MKKKIKKNKIGTLTMLFYHMSSAISVDSDISYKYSQTGMAYAKRNEKEIEIRNKKKEKKIITVLTSCYFNHQIND